MLNAAQMERSPVVVGFGGMMVDAQWLETRGIAMLGRAALTAVERAGVPEALMFNEAQSMAQIEQALDAGSNCVLLSTEGPSADEELEATARLARKAHGIGAAVEAELGHLPDAMDPSVHGEMTDPDEAARFVSIRRGRPCRVRR